MPSLPTVIGVVVLGTLFFRLVMIAVRWLQAGKKPSWTAQLEKGSWAVVTGASDGIGREFALQLGRLGLNVCLMARTGDKLKEVASQIKKESGVEVECIPVDFARVNLESLGRLLAPMLNRQVAVLVNNVGVSHEHPEFYGEVDPAMLDRLIAVNVTTPLRLTRLLLPFMLQRKKGLVLNVGSMASCGPCPLLQTYAASKAFLWEWSQSLSLECSLAGVNCHLLNAYYVCTRMSKLKQSSWMAPTPRDWVQAALAQVGPGAAAIVTPYWSHALLYELLIKLVPASWLGWAAFVQLGRIRTKALEKAKK